MSRSSEVPETSKPALADCPGLACERAPRRRLARDLFLLGLKESLGRTSAGRGPEPAPPLASLLGRALAGLSSSSSPAQEDRLAAVASDGL